LVAQVLPMNGSELRAMVEPSATAMIFVGPPLAGASNLTVTEKQRYLRRRFGLTHAEARVALSSLNAKSRRAMAVDLGIAETTVRSHLNRIFDKTGVKRQTELIQLLMRDISFL
jgi:DNA-binding CsgD family transcriptional regulator